MSNIYEKLLNIQNDLKAPKNQKNTFGNYNYRSCEDILEAVKPLCKSNKAVLTINDEIILLEGRYYVKSTATLSDVEKIEDKISITALAREEEIKKGMDASQITGATSSYARKYALNGLFCIDDTKDPDTDSYKKQQDKVKKEDKVIEEIDINATVTFGKYKGLSWIEVYEENKSYFDYLIENAKTPEGAETYKKIRQAIEDKFINIEEDK